MAPGSFVDLLVNATDKATGESLSDLERTNQAFVMVMSGVTQPTGDAFVTWSKQQCKLSHVLLHPISVGQHQNMGFDDPCIAAKLT